MVQCPVSLIKQPYETEIIKENFLTHESQLNTEKLNLLHRRNRTKISNEQGKILQRFFETNQFPDGEQRMQLVKITGLSTRVIQVWFQNRRREKKTLKPNDNA